MAKPSNRLKGVMLCLGGIILLSPDSLLLRVIGADLWTLAFWRGGLSAIGLTLVIFLLEGRQECQRQMLRLNRYAVIVAVNFALANLAFIFAIMNTAVANALVIMSMSPLIAAILSHFLFREPISARTWVAAITIFAGLTVVFHGSLHSGGAVGDMAALVTSICVAVSFVLIRKHREISMLPALTWSGALVCLITLPLATPAALSGTPLILMLLLGLLILPVSLAMIGLSPRYLPAPEVSLILRLEALLAPLWVWLVLGEIPTRQTLVGGSIILATLVCLSAYAIYTNRGNQT
ncbi:MAG TPA: EamA/RhaT family transporter [Gammaproteobacteria bacterium]|nr:EamA/RhaT family transporter [Gammaproteobacteria bacterium]